MKNFIKPVKLIAENFKSFLGLNKMTNEFTVFSNVHLGFLMFYTLQLVFMNTLLRRFSSDNSIIYLYNMIFFVFIPVGMSLAVCSVKKKSCIFTMQSSLYLWIGILVTTLSLIITKQIGKFWILLALISSLANGCYWIAYYMALTDYTTVENRDVGLSIIGIYTGVANVIVPLIGGYVIKIFDNYTGYIVMFFLAFLVAVFAIIQTKKLVPTSNAVVQKPESVFDDPKVHLLTALKSVVSDKIWFFSSMSEFFRGIRDGVFIFLLNLLVFSVSSNEALVGVNAFIAGTINIISNWVLGKLLYSDSNKNNKVKLLVVSVAVLSASSFLILLKLNVWTLIIMTCINAFFTIFIQNITQSVFCLSVQVNEEANKLRAESFVLKSGFLAFGRLVGILFILILPETNIYIVLGMLLLSILQIGTVVTTKKTLQLISEIK